MCGGASIPPRRRERCLTRLTPLEIAPLPDLIPHIAHGPPYDWDGETMGELESAAPGSRARTTRTPTQRIASQTMDGSGQGDIVIIDATGTIQVQDRSKDLIKSGGEWISSVALECALMGHPSIAEAAVIPVAHPKWDERPLAAVVLKPGAKASPADLRAFLAPQFPKFWLPDAFEFIDAIPRTSAGKFKKSALRERFRDYRLTE